jgi:hypothetical protein
MGGSLAALVPSHVTFATTKELLMILPRPRSITTRVVNNSGLIKPVRYQDLSGERGGLNGSTQHLLEATLY